MTGTEIGDCPCYPVILLSPVIPIIPIIPYFLPSFDAKFNLRDEGFDWNRDHSKHVNWSIIDNWKYWKTVMVEGKMEDINPDN